MAIDPQIKEKLFAAELRDDLLELDLHGYFVADIFAPLDQFLFDLYKNKEPSGRIIYGGGTGRLEKAVLEILRMHPLVLGVLEKPGHCLVVLKNS